MHPHADLRDSVSPDGFDDGLEPGQRRAPARRSLAAFGAFAAGLIVARATPGVAAASWFSLALGALAIAAAAGRPRRRSPVCAASLLAAVVGAAAGWCAARIHESPARSLDVLLNQDAGAEDRAQSPTIQVEGMLANDPRPEPIPAGALAKFRAGRAEGRDRATLVLWHATGPDGPVPVDGKVTLIAPSLPHPLFAAGTRVRATGQFVPTGPSLNPGESDSRQLAAQDGLDGRVGTLLASSQPLVVPIDDDDPPLRLSEHADAAWHGTIARLRSRTSAALESAIGGDDATGPGQRSARGVLRALLLGEYDAGATEVTTAFTRQGLVHILAISGFHLVVMAGVVLFAVRLTGDRGWVEPVIVALAVTLYMLIVPANAPVIRSGLMVLAVMGAEACGRRYDRLNVLGWVAIALLIWRPLDLWSLGWQLSFGIVAVLLGYGRSFHDRLFPPGLRGVVQPRPPRGVAGALVGSARFLRRRVQELLSTSLLCWLVAVPTILYHTGTFSPLAALTCLVVVPIATVLLWLGFVALLVGAVVPAAASLVGWALTWLATVGAGFVLWVDQWPWLVWRAGPVSIAWAIAATAAVLFGARAGGARRRRARFCIAIVIVWLVAELLLAPRIAASGIRGQTALRIDALAVGDGSCVLVRSGGDAVLWDCGSHRTDLGLRDVPRAVRALGASAVRTAVLSGARLERVAGILDAAEPLGIRRVLVGRAFLDAAEHGPATIQHAVVNGLRSRGIEVSAVGPGDSLQVGAATARFVWPPSGSPFASTNDVSLAATITVPTTAGPRSMLFTGDNGPEALAAIADAAGHADVLELPRRRDSADAAASLILRCGPEVVIDSSSLAGAAHSGSLAPLRHNHRWISTAMDGAARVRIGSDGSVRVHTFREDEGR